MIVCLLPHFPCPLVYTASLIRCLLSDDLLICPNNNYNIISNFRLLRDISRIDGRQGKTQR